MSKKKRIECAVCGSKVEYAYTSVVFKGKISKVCSANCFNKAVKYEQANNNGSVNGVNRSMGAYRFR